jgi:hypothetical protein
MPWAMLQAELLRFLSATGNPAQFNGLQIVPVPSDALWDNPNWGTWLGFETANNIPSWGPVYKPSAGNRVTDAYFAFLTNIDAPAQDNDAATQVKGLGAQLTAALEQITNAQQQLVLVWKAFSEAQQLLPPQLRQDFNDWFAQNGTQVLAPLENTYQNLVALWVVAANRAGGGYASLGQAMTDYNNATFQVRATDTNGTMLSYRTWNLIPRLADFISMAEAGQGTALSLQIDTHTDTTNTTALSMWEADSNAAFNTGFLAVGNQNSFERFTVDTSTQDFAISFSAKAFTGIQVTSGQWFNQNVVLQFQKGPFIPGGPFGPGKAVFFGPNGTFNLMIDTLYVMYQPTIAATVDATTYSRIQHGWDAGLRIALGPFLFSSELSDVATFTDTNRTITMISHSPHPQLIAVNCTVMPG